MNPKGKLNNIVGFSCDIIISTETVTATESKHRSKTLSSGTEVMVNVTLVVC